MEIKTDGFMKDKTNLRMYLIYLKVNVIWVYCTYQISENVFSPQLCGISVKSVSH